MMAIETIFQREVDPAVRQAKEQRRARDEQGSAILETALSMIILLTFLFSVMETGFALYSYHFIAEAAREATRYAIVRGSSAGPTCSTYTSPSCAVTTPQITSYVQNLGFPGINPNKMTVNTTYAGYPTGATCSPSAACNNPGNQVTVTVQYNFPLNVPFIPAHTFAMSSTAAMIIQN
jgi:Flp pilus assembly protein TadG